MVARKALHHFLPLAKVGAHHFFSTAQAQAACQAVARKPKIIFAEHPKEPVLGRILPSLLPTLKRFSYKQFYDATQPTQSLDTAITELECAAGSYQALDAHFKLLDLDIESSADIARYAGPHPNFEQYIRKLQHWGSYLSFLHSLRQGGFVYQGVDPNYAPSRAFTQEEQQAYHQHVAKQYLKAPNDSFGRMSVSCIPGIQAAILRACSMDKVQKEFLFFSFYSHTAMQDKALHFPLGIHVIDAHKNTIASIIQQIERRIEQHIQQQEAEKTLSSDNGHRL